MIIRILLITLGTVSLGLGILGIFVPGLPTTPFLLLTAGLYMRSSDRLHRMLITNRLVGPYLSDWRRSKGLSLRTKLKSIILMWAMIILSMIFGISSLWLKLSVIMIGVVGTIVMGFIIRTNHR
jgi:uncharacterized protein